MYSATMGKMSSSTSPLYCAILSTSKQTKSSVCSEKPLLGSKNLLNLLGVEVTFSDEERCWCCCCCCCWSSFCCCCWRADSV
ncbi:wsv125 [White spot syndrome virus]|uniref:Wsv125 n=4 Tax=White spot syndrome virus TaxID=342409 RepID=Q8VB63_WSSVS|nr:wsv125 [Shrimp white spot syndrome virus]AFX59502.1 wsv125 [White spot syndrome virus]AAL33129.1 wsv125 [Shrimp white spot syndrome virus]AAL89049.1 WSSV181 [Shrimp white spot syndrome virus]AWQ60313.1 wsv125 [Shrimp white spot syndrome virus]AWQ60726.1 wsv125 [Shrimp white spot syndrome virus]